ncbi:hypothetical protein niasHT_021911 [Heterodera trifolii]|uniref:N-acetyltransferase domain-containing protein n=1 Tax=Heterodera trifolii TaxID=157864 RepID=A0ABD2KD89_9BILA
MFLLAPFRGPCRPRVLKTLCSLKVRHFSTMARDYVIETVNFTSERDSVFKFMQEVFLVNEPITRVIGCTPSDTSPIFDDICEKCSKFDLSFAAKNNDGKILGVLLNAPFKLENIHESYRDIGRLPNKKEFGEEIRNGPFPSQNANRIYAILSFVNSHIALLPHEEDIKLVELQAMAVGPGDARTGLGTAMLRALIQTASAKGYSHLFTCATAIASQTGLKKFGFEEIKTVPFNSFLEDGVPIFSGVHDNGVGAKLVALHI